MVEQSPIHDQINLHQFKRFVKTNSIQESFVQNSSPHTYHWFTQLAAIQTIIQKYQSFFKPFPISS